jgi:hypothetical protein
MAGPSLGAGGRRLDSARLGLAGLAVLTAGWTVIVVGERFGLLTLPPIPRLGALLSLAPVAAVAWIAMRRATLPAGAGWLVAFALAVSAALYTAGAINASPQVALAVPALAVAGVAAVLRPAFVVSGLFVVCAAYGSLLAFLGAPVSSMTNVAIGGLLVALVVRLVIEREYALRVPLGIWLMLAYLGLTVLSLPFAEDRTLALQGFDSSAWHIFVAVAIGLAGWSPATQRRAARAVVAIAALVGAYAIVRWAIGPDPKEYDLALSESAFVAGKFKTIGSLPSAQDLGIWSAVMIPFCAAATLTWRGRLWRGVAGLATLLCTLGLFASQLRIGLVAALAGLAVTVTLFHAARSIPGLHLGSTAVSAAVAVLVVIGAYFVTGSDKLDPTHGYQKVLTPLEDFSVQERLFKWEQAVVDAGDHPFGRGVGTAAQAQARQQRYYTGVGYVAVDNGYLKVALEQGFAVMFLFIVAIVALLINLGRGAIRLPDRAGAGIAMGATGALSAMIVLLMLLTALDGLKAVALWVVVGLGVAQVATRPAAESDRAAAAP